MYRFAWAYRILLALGLLIGAALLLAKVVIALAKPALLWLVELYPPYIAMLLIAALLLVICFQIRNSRRRRCRPATPELPQAEDDAQKIDAAFSALAAQFGGACGPNQSSFTLPFPHLEDAIWCAKEEDEIIVGLVGSPHHAHFPVGNDDFPAGAFEEIAEIMSEQQVHVIFYAKDGKEHYNDLCRSERLDELLYARLHPLRTPEPWWQRGLRLLFLWFPPFRPSVVRAEIYTYSAAVPRVVNRENCPTPTQKPLA